MLKNQKIKQLNLNCIINKKYLAIFKNKKLKKNEFIYYNEENNNLVLKLDFNKENYNIMIYIIENMNKNLYYNLYIFYDFRTIRYSKLNIQKLIKV